MEAENKTNSIKWGIPEASDIFDRRRVYEDKLRSEIIKTQREALEKAFKEYTGSSECILVKLSDSIDPSIVRQLRDKGYSISQMYDNGCYTIKISCYQPSSYVSIERGHRHMYISPFEYLWI